MTAEKYIIGIIVIIGGLLFALFNKPISKGSAQFYRKFYTAKNLRVMFILVALLLIFIGIVILMKA